MKIQIKLGKRDWYKAIVSFEFYNYEKLICVYEIFNNKVITNFLQDRLKKYYES